MSFNWFLIIDNLKLACNTYIDTDFLYTTLQVMHNKMPRIYMLLFQNFTSLDSTLSK